MANAVSYFAARCSDRLMPSDNINQTSKKCATNEQRNGGVAVVLVFNAAK
jgi:hypothetical protein